MHWHRRQRRYFDLLWRAYTAPDRHYHNIRHIAGCLAELDRVTDECDNPAAIEMAIIMGLYWNNGFAWLNRGYEYVLLWGLVCFAIALRGGGPYSLDRLLGKEL